MKSEFEDRWQTAARSARAVTGDTVEELPFGFTTRLLARFEKAPTEPWEDLLSVIGLKAVMASALIFLASTVLVAWQFDVESLAAVWMEVPSSSELFLP